MAALVVEGTFGVQSGPLCRHQIGRDVSSYQRAERVAQLKCKPAPCDFYIGLYENDLSLPTKTARSFFLVACQQPFAAVLEARAPPATEVTC